MRDNEVVLAWTAVLVTLPPERAPQRRDRKLFLGSGTTFAIGTQVTYGPQLRSPMHQHDCRSKRAI